MSEHELTAEDVAKIIGVSKFTVDMWRSKNGNQTPKNLFELLRIKTEYTTMDAL